MIPQKTDVTNSEFEDLETLRLKFLVQSIKKTGTIKYSKLAMFCRKYVLIYGLLEGLKFFCDLHDIDITIINYNVFRNAYYRYNKSLQNQNDNKKEKNIPATIELTVEELTMTENKNNATSIVIEDPGPWVEPPAEELLANPKKFAALRREHNKALSAYDEWKKNNK